MPLLSAVFLFGMTAYRTGLRSICRVKLYDMTPGAHKLIHQFFFQVMVGPADNSISVSDADPFCCRADACKILQREQRAFGLGADECL